MDRGVRHLPQEKLAALATLGTQVALLLESNRKPGSPKPGISLRPTNIIDSRFALDTVFSSLPGLYWLLEPEELRVIAVSDSALDTVGGKREDVVGRNIEDALREGDLAEAIDRQAEAMDALREGARNLGEALAENGRTEADPNQQAGQGETPGGRPVPGRRDPLGRQLGQGGEFGTDQNMV
ncbi:MAG: DUF4175 family protein, partial [Proteobacteria bacterium]|nr:DUF4175 family protein [Pseudomonadota bacterium]